MIQNERESRHNHILSVARQMMTAARTAPKAKGLDIIEVATISGNDLTTLAEMMISISNETGMKFFLRDADNVLNSECVVIIGTHSRPLGFNCAHCGFALCADKPDNVPCAINSVDVGIALGSACATAADLRVDTRVLFSAGIAAQRLNWLNGCRQVFAIAVSASSKSPYFDRKPKEVK